MSVQEEVSGLHAAISGCTEGLVSEMSAYSKIPQKGGDAKIHFEQVFRAHKDQMAVLTAQVVDLATMHQDNKGQTPRSGGRNTLTLRRHQTLSQGAPAQSLRFRATFSSNESFFNFKQSEAGERGVTESYFSVFVEVQAAHEALVRAIQGVLQGLVSAAVLRGTRSPSRHLLLFKR